MTEEPKKRILVTIVGLGSVIHIVRTGLLDQMKQFCKPVVALTWSQPDLITELHQKGFEVHIIPEYQTEPVYIELRKKITTWYQQYVLKTPSTNIKKTFNAQYYSKKKYVRQKIKDLALKTRFSCSPGYIKRLIKEEELAMQVQPSYNVYRQWVSNLQLDGIFTVTPFYEPIECIARLLKSSGKQILASVHSFDNVTKRGWPAIYFDQYIVWNKYNKNELARINPALLAGDRIAIAGAPQFDFHFNPSYFFSREEWLQKEGIPHDKKIILYAGGPVSIFPHEPQYLLHLVNAIRSKQLTDCVILFRCHPLDHVERWKNAVGEHPFLIYDSAAKGAEKLDHGNVQTDHIKNLVSTLKFTDVHINLCSTMTVDGSVFLKPQIAPGYTEAKSEKEAYIRKMYQQEHYLPILRSKVLNIANSRIEMIALVNKALAYPDKMNTHCTDCVEEIITYTDGRSAERVSTEICKFYYQ